MARTSPRWTFPRGFPASSSRSGGFPTRVWRYTTGGSVDREIAPHITYSSQAVDDSINTDELLAGVGAAALAAAFADLVTYQAATRFRMRIEWLVPAFRLPGQVVRDMVIVYHALWRRVAHGEQPPSAFLELPARFGDDSP